MQAEFEQTDVAIIGAGPSGAAAANWLAQQGLQVKVLERSHFPRFSIGESLLPQCMEYLDFCGLLETATTGNFQRKNGAAFSWGEQYRDIDFSDKFSPGPATTWQVERSEFDHQLIRGAQASGVDVEFGSQVVGFEPDATEPVLQVQPENGDAYALKSRFVLDASGYGRVLARLCNLEKASRLESRCALFTHMRSVVDDENYDRKKILICIHPSIKGIWYWFIPFPENRFSVGVVGTPDQLALFGDDDTQRLQNTLLDEPRLAKYLKGATSLRDTSKLAGYSADVSALHGPGYALLGNAGEFLDPVFSSGVTIALKSAVLAAPLVHRQLQGETIDWPSEFEQPLRAGVNTFKAFVNAWYTNELPDIIFSDQDSVRIRQMISAVLAGYAWDSTNPLVSASERRLTKLAELCRA
ncbi:NAD(P)/FAD-dependent oxidoreductase [Granulosicoccus antarcticus]|uniref:Aklavinone 12-hydroxylase RdmE n=1 Tax=Granulosicoccus antarcticus IMCC3135 TaxID=1192854 RepID=A0A2Z2P859_9GAMM|nr:NAD(P)/FAD-dependent oxidoreductase [Granulosicoccus antarcticus]ASJ76857.1 Aklavinone 12-hydroxylase RdmE [Granulosicoccus antarcticus IMCC3135]